jgi:hypothetical protein
MGIPSFSINRKRLFLMSGPCRFDPGFAISRTVPFRSLPRCVFSYYSASFRVFPHFSAFFLRFVRCDSWFTSPYFGDSFHFPFTGISSSQRFTLWQFASWYMGIASLSDAVWVFVSPFRIPSVWRLFVRTLRFFGVLRKHNRTLRKPWFLSVRERLRSVGRSG